MKKRNYWNQLIAYLYRRGTRIETWNYEKEINAYMRAYKKKRKERKWRFLVLIDLLVIIYLSNCGLDDVRLALEPYRNEYKNDWAIYRIDVDEEVKELYICFRQKASSSDKGESIRTVYDAVIKAVYNDGWYKWLDYSIDLQFIEFRNDPKYLDIRNDSSLLSLEIRDYAHMYKYIVTVTDIAEYFPETKKLYTNTSAYTEIGGFDNLEYLYMGDSDEKIRAYIWGIFPDCVVEDKEGVYYSPEI